VSYLWQSSPVDKRKATTKPIRSGNKGILYAFLPDKGKKNFHKVGKANDWEKRRKQYKTGCYNGELFHKVECDDIHHSERVLHGLLKTGGYHFDTKDVGAKEIFKISGTTLKEYMDVVAALEKVIMKGNEEIKMRKIAQFINKIK